MTFSRIARVAGLVPAALLLTLAACEDDGMSALPLGSGDAGSVESAGAGGGDSIQSLPAPTLLSWSYGVKPLDEASATARAASTSYSRNIRLEFNWGDGGPNTYAYGDMYANLTSVHAYSRLGTFNVTVQARYWYVGDLHVPPGYFYSLWSAPVQIRVAWPDKIKHEYAPEDPGEPT